MPISPRSEAGRENRFIRWRRPGCRPVARHSRRLILGPHVQQTPTSQTRNVTETRCADHAHLGQERMTSVESDLAGPNCGRLDAPAVRLRNGNPSGPKFGPGWPGRTCGARTRAQRSCANPAMPNGRCRMHGGKSTGPRTRKKLAPEEGEDERGPRTAKPSQADPCAGASKEPRARAKEGVRTASRPRRKAPQQRTSPSCKERSQAGRSRAALERALYPGGRPLYEEEVEALLNTPEPFSFWWDVVVPIALLCLAIWQPVLLVHLIIDCIAPNPTQPTRPASRHATH